MPAKRKKTPSEEAARRIAKVRQSNANSLDLSSLELTAIPDSLAQLAQLRALHISHNQIAAIPDSLAHLAPIEFLSLSRNQITAVPDSLAQLAQRSEERRVGKEC